MKRADSGLAPRCRRRSLIVGFSGLTLVSRFIVTPFRMVPVNPCGDPFPGIANGLSTSTRRLVRMASGRNEQNGSWRHESIHSIAARRCPILHALGLSTRSAIPRLADPSVQDSAHIDQTRDPRQSCPPRKRHAVTPHPSATWAMASNLQRDETIVQHRRCRAQMGERCYVIPSAV